MDVITSVGIAALALLAAVVSVALVYRSIFVRDYRCPRCGPLGALDRTPRRFGDHLIGRLIACRRYQCLACGWEGLIPDRADRPTDGGRTQAGRSGDFRGDRRRPHADPARDTSRDESAGR
jgi:predicted RNA-binding Zn-ribbon protein involved in translation (DUF1610 family)